MYEAFADYDMTGSIRTQAIAVLNGRKRKPVELPSGSRQQQFRAIMNDVVKATEAAGAPEGYSVIHITEQRHQLAILTAFTGAEKAICALSIEPGTGDPMFDLRLVTNMADAGGHSVLEPSGWEDDEPRCEIDADVAAMILS